LSADAISSPAGLPRSEHTTRPNLTEGHTPGKKKATPRTQGPVLEATTAGFIDALVAAGGPPIYKMSVADARNVLDSLQSKPVAKLAAQIEDLRIPAGPTGERLRFASFARKNPAVRFLR
jgi:hypothetical protein